MPTSEEAKQKIIDLFNKNVRGKTGEAKAGHDGAGGHWLERQMGVKANASNAPDLFGYEMKNDTTSKTTFGDWSPNEKIFGKKCSITRDDFLRIFGKRNAEKEGRLSWSGEPCPKYGKYNKFGQTLAIDADQNIRAIYSYSKDLRLNKAQIVPPKMQVENLVLATWRHDKLRAKLERKFNQNGWFKCLKDDDGKYCQIVFGKPMNYESWIALVKTGVVFFDSGMYQGNNRPYSQWRAQNSYWESLIDSRH